MELYSEITSSKHMTCTDCSRQYIDKKIRDGSLQALRDGGNGRLYTASEVAKFRE